MPKVKIRVTHKQVRDVPIYRQEWENGKWRKTKDVLRVDKIERERVLFSGSDKAFDIWKKVHWLPHDANIDRKVKLD